MFSSLRKLWLGSQVLGFANSACNPFVYCIFSEKFRNGFKEVCCKRGANIGRNSTNETKRLRDPTTSDTGYGSLNDRICSIDND